MQHKDDRRSDAAAEGADGTADRYRDEQRLRNARQLNDGRSLRARPTLAGAAARAAVVVGAAARIAGRPAAALRAARPADLLRARTCSASPTWSCWKRSARAHGLPAPLAGAEAAAARALGAVPRTPRRILGRSHRSPHLRTDAPAGGRGRARSHARSRSDSGHGDVGTRAGPRRLVAARAAVGELGARRALPPLSVGRRERPQSVRAVRRAGLAARRARRGRRSGARRAPRHAHVARRAGAAARGGDRARPVASTHDRHAGAARRPPCAARWPTRCARRRSRAARR